MKNLLELAQELDDAATTFDEWSLRVTAEEVATSLRETAAFIEETLREAMVELDKTAPK